jgi:hypothetical protein
MGAWAPRRSCGHGSGTGECRTCKRARDARRPSRQQRGLGAEYDRERRQVLAGATHCARCGKPFGPDRRPTAGHVTASVDGGGTTGNLRPECAPCNYGDGARLRRPAGA